MTERNKPFVRVTRRLRNIDGATPFVTLEVTFSATIANATGKMKEVISRIHFQNSLIDKPNQILSQLRDAGANLPEGNAALDIIRTALKPVFDNTVPTIDLTARTGWHGTSFILPGRTFGQKKEQLEFLTTDDSPLARTSRGTLQKWKKGLTTPCRESPVLVFTISLAFAACLLPFSKLREAAIFMLQASSGAAKSLASRAALSVFASAESTEMSDFNMTQTALEEFCAAHNEMLVVLDDAATIADTQAECERILSRIAYSLTGGSGRKRSAKIQAQGLPNLKFRNLILTSFEETLQKSEPNLKRRGGEQNRLIEIPVHFPKKGGIFFKKGLKPKEIERRMTKLIDMVGRAIDKNYGVAFEPYIEAVIADYSDIPKLIEEITVEFINTVGTQLGTPQGRIAEKFALVCAGGRLAARYGVAPWSERRCVVACKILFRRVMRLYGMDVSVAVTAGSIAQALLDKFDASPKHFPEVQKGKPFPQNIPEDTVLGVRRRIKGTDCILIPKSKLAKIIDVERVIPSTLYEITTENMLPFASSRSATTQISMIGWPGGPDKPSFYAFPLEKLRSLV